MSTNTAVIVSPENYVVTKVGGLTPAITVVISPANHVITKVGVQGPKGPKGNPGIGFTVYATTAEMFAVTGDPGDIAYCEDYPDQHWKWNTNQNTWVPAF